MLPEKRHINLHLDAHNVSLDVDEDKEEFYRQAAVLLNQRYQRYLRNVPSASAEQLWLYVALDVAVNLCSDAREKSLEPVVKQISEWNTRLETILNNNETQTTKGK